jgi:hydrogenase nickel incorporation protein HypB
MTKIPLKSRVMQKNDEIAGAIREKLKAQRIFCLNMIGSPGSGKTSLLETLFKLFDRKGTCAVIEGDVKTDNDRQRIEKAGVQAVQIETDGACHLNAAQVDKMLTGLALDGVKYLFIENVGNLICPAAYDLGENKRMIVISVAEGEDKPLKYPSAFMRADMVVITKIDLAEYVDVDIETLKNNALSINPKLDLFLTSVKTNTGIDSLMIFLKDSYGRYE